MSDITGPLGLVALMGGIFDRLDVPWVLGGSLASSLAGEPRATMDIDIAAPLRAHHVDPLLAQLGDDFYAERTAILDAVEARSSFNVVHYPTAFKIDVFVLGDGLLDRLQLERREQVWIGPDTAPLWVGSVVDQVARKLSWFDLGGRISDRQWRDIVGVLRVHRRSIRSADLRDLAQKLGLEELLDQAISDADEVPS